jgi:hypothetical protein
MSTQILVNFFAKEKPDYYSHPHQKHPLQVLRGVTNNITSFSIADINNLF